MTVLRVLSEYSCEEDLVLFLRRSLSRIAPMSFQYCLGYEHQIQYLAARGIVASHAQPVGSYYSRPAASLGLPPKSWAQTPTRRNLLSQAVALSSAHRVGQHAAKAGAPTPVQVREQVRQTASISLFRIAGVSFEGRQEHVMMLSEGERPVTWANSKIITNIRHS